MTYAMQQSGAKTKAMIKRASMAARASMNQVDKQVLDDLDQIYRRAADEITRVIEGFAGANGSLRLEVLRDIRNQINARLAFLEDNRNQLLSGSLKRAAELGAGGFTPAVVSSTLSHVADEAVRFVHNFVHEDGLQLSDRLWRVDQHARQVVGQALENSIIQGHSASQAANDLLSRGENVPREIINKINQANAGRVGKITADALLRGEGSPRYNALRVFRTEMNRAHGEAYMMAGEGVEGRAGWRYLLSPAHPEADICDMHARVNRYGLGPGVYPDRKRCPWPAHPNTLSYTEIVFADEISEEDRAGQIDRIDWLKEQPYHTQVSVLGSRKKQTALINGILTENQIGTPWKILKKRYEKAGIDTTGWSGNIADSIDAIPLPVEKTTKYVYKEAKTIKEAEDWVLSNNLAQVVKYKGLKLSVANRVNAHLANLFNSFNLQTMVRISAGTTKGRAWASANARVLNLQNKFFNNPTVGYKQSVVEYFNIAKQQHDRYLGIVNDPSLPKHIKDMAKNSLDRYEQKLKFGRFNFLQNGKEIENVISHEIGHTISDQAIGMINPPRNWEAIDKWDDVVRKMKQNGDIYKISEYGSKNRDEAFAEAFSMYVHDRNKLPQYVIDGLEEVINALK